EWVHVQLHQQKGMISLSPPTICNSAFALHHHLPTSYTAVVGSYAGTAEKSVIPIGGMVWISKIIVR
ncbi:hypothetical protein, partial [Escherichia coli]|uniref:hypothetical protein n=1 Tax=Escherichia coli TaxID=562 RepID=UPI001E5923D2